MISAIIFDCDGVLVDSEVLAQEVELATLVEFGLHYEQGEYQARFMGLSTEAFYTTVEKDFRARLGHDMPADFRDLCHARFTSALPRLREISGARRAVEEVALPKAVASSSATPALDRKLRMTGLWEPFAPHIYSADHVTHAKPAPDLFLYAADALRLAPAHCLVLEDSANGVTAARAAGMQVWGFTGGGHMNDAAGARLIAAGAERLVPDWPEASRAFAALA